jgi:glycosyltransferase involved in cell wall biosynthesis
MKIAMVSEYTNQRRYVIELATALYRGGHEVTFYTRRDRRDQPPEDRADGGYRVIRLPAGPYRPVSRQELMPYLGQFAAALAATWRREVPDVVHAHYWMSGLAALLAANELSLPVVQTYHALAAVERRQKGAADAELFQRIQMERLVGRRASWVVAICSDEVAELAMLGVPRSKTSVVPGGVDCERFTPEDLHPHRAGPFRLLSVGPLVPHSGFGDVITAVARVPSAELVIAGGPEAGRLGDDEEAKRLWQLSRRLGVTDRVRLVGRLPASDRLRVLRWADAVVCAPWYEPLGLAALEAMATGVPVVATEVGCLRDAVVHRVTGEHVPVRRPAALAATLYRLSTDQVTLEEYAVAGRDRATARFAWERIAADAHRVYEQVRE